MNVFTWILVSTILMSLIAWVGALTLFLRDELVDELLLSLVALAAGGLIGGAFLHLLPQAIAEFGQTDTLPLFILVIVGFCLFYVLEQFLHWHHHHAATHEHEPVTYLVLIADSAHNFIDGLVIASAYVVAIPVGIVTTLAVGLHEIPQEIGDFGVLVYGGFDRRRALVLNFLSQSTVILGGIVGFFLSGIIADVPTLLLPFAAGNFIYIASSDLIPEIKGDHSVKRSIQYFFVFLGGIVLMLAIRLLRSTVG